MRALAVASLAAVVLLAAAPGAPQSSLPETFAFRARASGNNRPVRVEITIERWSEPGVSEQLVPIVTELGGPGLKAALQQLPQVAEMRVDAYRSYPLHYAREFVADDGSRSIFLATHVPIGFQGGEGYFRASAAALTLIELRVDAGGEGDGTAEVTEEVGIETGAQALALSGTRSGSVRLSSVRRVSPE